MLVPVDLLAQDLTGAGGLDLHLLTYLTPTRLLAAVVLDEAVDLPDAAPLGDEPWIELLSLPEEELRAFDVVPTRRGAERSANFCRKTLGTP